MEEEKRTSIFPVFDADIFAALEQEILPILIKQARLGHQALRVWIIECGTGEVPTMVTIMFARLLGHMLPNMRIQIFATDRDDTHLASAHSGILDKTILSYIRDSEIVRFCEPVGNEYRLNSSLRKLMIFSRHDPQYDPFLAQLNLIICGFSLLAHPIEHQQRFLSQMSGSLNQSSYIVFARQDCATLASFPYQPVREGIPIYQYRAVKEKPVSLLFAREQTDAQTSTELVATTLQHMLRTSSADANGSEKKEARKQVLSTFAPVALDVLLRMAPIGIMVIDHRYQVLSFNRAAYKQLTLLGHEGRPLDFFHSIAGLPYQEVRMAVDTVMREGTSLTIEEVELTISTGGNGRILSMEICLMPTEIGTPPQLAIYIQDITMQTVEKKIHLKQTQELSATNAHLIQKCNNIESIDGQLREMSRSLLVEYQYLATQLEEMQEAKNLLEQQVEQLLEEIMVLNEQID